MRAFLLAAASFTLITGSVQAAKFVAVPTLACYVPGQNGASGTVQQKSDLASVVLCYASGVHEDSYCSTGQDVSDPYQGGKQVDNVTTASSANEACVYYYGAGASAQLKSNGQATCPVIGYDADLWGYGLCIQLGN